LYIKIQECSWIIFKPGTNLPFGDDTAIQLLYRQIATESKAMTPLALITLWTLGY